MRTIKTTETYKTISSKINNLNNYLNSEQNAQMFLYQWSYRNKVEELISILNMKLETIVYLNQFEVSVYLTDGQIRILEIANNN